MSLNHFSMELLEKISMQFNIHEYRFRRESWDVTERYRYTRYLKTITER
jgi:hypothetical protein